MANMRWLDVQQQRADLARIERRLDERLEPLPKSLLFQLVLAGIGLAAALVLCIALNVWATNDQTNTQTLGQHVALTEQQLSQAEIFVSTTGAAAQEIEEAQAEVNRIEPVLSEEMRKWESASSSAFDSNLELAGLIGASIFSVMLGGLISYGIVRRVDRIVVPIRENQRSRT